jgi:RNA polymerase sigma-70 factor (ECF subfamily)
MISGPRKPESMEIGDPDIKPEHTFPFERDHVARLNLAQDGDSQEFAYLVEPYRRELQVHCYRILGSLHEAEDLVQETMLRAWQRLDTYEGRGSLRSWLYKISTNACLDALDRRRTRRSLPAGVFPVSDPNAQIKSPLQEPVWLEPFPDEWLAQSSAGPEARYISAESISLAFLAALQSLPPRQRAVLILSDVLDFPARETAEITGMTLSAVNSALHRARATLARRYHGRQADSLAGSEPDVRTQELLEQYVQAWETADVAGLVALLKEEARFSMPPSPSWYQGRASIGAFVAATVFGDRGMFPGEARRRWRLLPTKANAQPAYAIYQRMETGEFQAFGIHLLDFERGLISEITSFIDPSLPGAFNFPHTLRSPGSAVDV